MTTKPESRKGENFLLWGGSKDTHAVMQETALKINEHLDRRGKRLEDVSAKELRDICNEVKDSVGELVKSSNRRVYSFSQTSAVNLVMVLLTGFFFLKLCFMRFICAIAHNPQNHPFS